MISKSNQSYQEFQPIVIDGIEFSYKAIKEHRKTISVSIPLDKKLIVKTPIRFSKKEVEDFLKKKSLLIVNRLSKAEERKKISTKLEDSYKHGGSAWFLGKKYKLLADNSKRRSIVKSDALCHTYDKNHQKKFYDLLESKLKNWKEIDKKLKMFSQKNIFLC